MKLTEILPGRLYQRGAFAHFSAEDKARALREHDIRAVVCLWGQPDPDMLGTVRYFHLPVTDGKRINPAPLLVAAYEVVDAMGDGAALSHCRAGRNRSGFFNALLVRELCGVSGSEALEIVRKARPNAVANEAYDAFLERLGAP